MFSDVMKEMTAVMLLKGSGRAAVAQMYGDGSRKRNNFGHCSVKSAERYLKVHCYDSTHKSGSMRDAATPFCILFPSSSLTTHINVVSGTSQKAIRAFVVASGGTPDNPCQAVMSTDATDMNCSSGARLVKVGGSWLIQCAEDTGDMQQVLGFSDTPVLEKTLNMLAKPLEDALKSKNLVYAPVNRVEAILFFTDQVGPLMEKAIAATDDYVATTTRFYKANGGEYEKGKQKNCSFLKFKVKEAARRVEANCKEILAPLTNGRALTEDELVEVLETVKLVILAIVEVSTHYLAVLLHNPSGSILIPICRLYYGKMSNKQIVDMFDSLKKTVEEVSGALSSSQRPLLMESTDRGWVKLLSRARRRLARW
jgi:hypothetical protein